MNGRVARAEHVAEAGRTLWRKRGERACSADHDTQAMRAGASCPTCGAAK